MTSSPSSRPPPRRRHRMIDRIAMILDITARSSNGLTLTEIATSVGAPVSTTQALINGLVATGFLEERQARTYVLGTAPHLLNLLAGRRIVSRVAHEQLQELHDLSGLTAVSAVRVGDDVFYVDSVGANDRYNQLTETFVRSSMIYSSTGLVLLAGLPKDEAWSYLASLPESDSSRVARYFELLPQINATGVCAAPGVSKDGDGVAIAVRRRGETVGSVGLIGPAPIIAQRTDELSEMLESRSSWWSAPQE